MALKACFEKRLDDWNSNQIIHSRTISTGMRKLLMKGCFIYEKAEMAERLRGAYEEIHA